MTLHKVLDTDGKAEEILLAHPALVDTVHDERDNCRNEGSLVIIKSHTHGERKPVVRSAAMIIAAKSRVFYRINIESEHHLGHLQPRGSLFFFIPNLGP